MIWLVEQEGDTFVLKAPHKDAEGNLFDSIAMVRPGEIFRGVPYERLKDAQIWEDDGRGGLKEQGPESVIADIDRILGS